jgi:hypothetical protein
MRLAERIGAVVTGDAATGCAVWTGPTRRGVPVLSVRGQMVKAQPLAWWIAQRRLAAGWTVTGRCPHPATCVNVFHLRPQWLAAP